MVPVINKNITYISTQIEATPIIGIVFLYLININIELINFITCYVILPEKENIAGKNVLPAAADQYPQWPETVVNDWKEK